MAGAEVSVSQLNTTHTVSLFCQLFPSALTFCLRIMGSVQTQTCKTDPVLCTHINAHTALFLLDLFPPFGEKFGLTFKWECSGPYQRVLVTVMELHNQNLRCNHSLQVCSCWTFHCPLKCKLRIFVQLICCKN